MKRAFLLMFLLTSIFALPTCAGLISTPTSTPTDTPTNTPTPRPTATATPRPTATVEVPKPTSTLSIYPPVNCHAPFPCLGPQPLCYPTPDGLQCDLHPAVIYNIQGYEYYSQGDYKSAIAFYDQAIEAYPNYGEAYLNRGNAYSEQGNYERAIADYQHYLELDPNTYKNIEGWISDLQSQLNP